MTSTSTKCLWVAAFRYCIVESDAALYVGVMGSLHANDWLTNANLFLDQLWSPVGGDSQVRRMPSLYHGVA